MAEEKQEKKKRSPMLMVLVILVALAAMGGAYFLGGGGGKSGAAPPKPPTVLTAPLPTFTVNLADGNYRRFLRLEVYLEYIDAKLAEELPQKQYRIRDAVISILRSKNTTDLDTPAKTEVLRQELLQAVNNQLEHKVTGVFFQELLIQ